MRTLVALLALVSVAAVASAGQDEPTLDIYVVDVEGGEATLFVSPTGESLLVDAGWPGFDGRDADRIAAAAAAAGVRRIDYLLVTHFHGDHMGGALQLADRLPVGTFVDHGSSPDLGRGQAAFDAYAALRRRATHLEVRPGDVVPIDGLDVRIIAAGGAVLDAPLPGAGRPNPHCRDFVFHGEAITSRAGDAEDQRSVSATVAYGAFRTVIMGDLTWNREHDLMCPTDRVGPVDAYLVSHHGAETSGSPALVRALAPRAAVMNNGPRKGGAAETFEILRGVPELQDLWQNHYAVEAGALNRPERFIANLDAGAGGAGAAEAAVHMDVPAHWIRLSARRDGSFTVINSRNGHRRDYAPRSSR